MTDNLPKDIEKLLVENGYKIKRVTLIDMDVEGNLGKKEIEFDITIGFKRAK